MNILTRPFRKPKKSHVEVPFIDQLANRFPDSTVAQREIIDSVTPYTMTSPERILALCEAVDHVCKNEIAGDIVECGVWKGGSMAAVAHSLVSRSQDHRTLWMYDTYDGMSEPTDNDVDLRGHSAERLLADADYANSESKDSIWCRCSLNQVKQTLIETGYPESMLRFVKGKVEDTLPLESPEQIAILRLDTDWYESTRCELEILFPKLVPGGVLIIDDYGHWQGCRKAVDEYFESQNVKMFLHRVDYTGRLGIKLG
ncbi:TylF/MycF/NovP-related O-methyltransferase [Mariniblastus fucicola]|uniref:Macrocin O-methyltransferase n=1 Tax=Mariniblastus fucicola TaxID=980251 RepID=A0A5B9PMF7_9BACT|nr:TylF/MycF/NovP-related O-methyltransferase [Mariniblastus fucicola]QEG23503.1 Macrocin O-methyltransferase [Mariniblastus fucicola]